MSGIVIVSLGKTDRVDLLFIGWWLVYCPSRKHAYIILTPLNPTFICTGVYISFFITAKNIDCGCSLEPPRRGGSNEYPQSMFLSRLMKKYQNFYLKPFSFWW